MKLRTTFGHCAVLILACMPVQTSQAADIFNGKTLYAMHCQSCHGPTGKGLAAGTPNFKRSRALMKPDSVLFTSIADGRRAMPGYYRILTEEEILNVIAFLRTML